MPQVVKSIVTRLSLDSKKFTSKISTAEKSILKFSGVAAGVGAALFALTKRTANYRDETTKLARSVGIPTQEFSELRHASEQAGLSLDEQRAILSKLSAPTEKQSKALKRLGITMRDTSGSATSTTSRLSQLADRIQKIENPAKRTETAFRIFGEQGVKAVSLLAQGSKGLDETRKKARELGIAFSDQAGRNAETFNDQLDNLTKAVTGASDSFGQVFINVAVTSGIFETLTNAITTVTGLFNTLDDETKESVARIAGITAGIAGLTAAFIILRKVAIASIKGIVSAIKKNPIIFAISTVATGLLVAAEHFGLFGDSADEADKQIDKTEKTVKKLTQSMTGLVTSLKQTAGENKKTKDSMKELVSETSKGVSLFSQFSSNVISTVRTISDFSQRTAEREIQTLDRRTQILEHHYQQTEEALGRSYDEQIEAVRIGEEGKTYALMNASNERLLLLDEEYQKAKELSQIAFEESLERDRENYEITKEFLLEQAIDRDQSRIAKGLLDEDFRLYTESRQNEHEQSLSDLQKTFLDKKKADEVKTNTAVETLKKASDDRVSGLESEKNTSLEKLGNEREAKLKDLERRKADIEYKASLEKFKVDKALGITEATISAAQGVAQTLPIAIGTLGPIAGPIVAAVLIASILASSGAQIAFIHKQQPPPKPLILQAGGVLSGPAHTAGGLNANLEGGEAVIDRNRTDRLFDSIDSGFISNRQKPSLIINIEPGAFQITGVETSEDLVEMVSERIAERLEGLGVSL